MKPGYLCLDPRYWWPQPLHCVKNYSSWPAVVGGFIWKRPSSSFGRNLLSSWIWRGHTSGPWIRKERIWKDAISGHVWNSNRRNFITFGAVRGPSFYVAKLMKQKDRLAFDILRKWGCQRWLQICESIGCQVWGLGRMRKLRREWWTTGVLASQDVTWAVSSFGWSQSRRRLLKPTACLVSVPVQVLENGDEW